MFLSETKGPEEISRGDNLVYGLFMVAVSWIYTYLLTHQDEYIKYVALFCMLTMPQ